MIEQDINNLRARLIRLEAIILGAKLATSVDCPHCQGQCKTEDKWGNRIDDCEDCESTGMILIPNDERGIIMSKKHYIAISNILKERLAANAHGPGYGAIKSIVEKLADYMKSDNPNFDRSRFLEACGISKD